MKTILFKVWKFPQRSETFIVNQIVLAIRMGYEVKILVGEFQDPYRNANLELFEKYGLEAKICIEDYKIPATKLMRAFKAGQFLLKNLGLFQKLKRYYKVNGKKGLLPLYEFFFYRQFRDMDIIHIQFGTNKHPVDLLKKTGFIKSRVIVSFHGHDLYFPINGIIQKNGYYDNLFNFGDLFVANTPFLRDLLIDLKAPLDKIETIPVSVNTDFFEPNNRNRELSVVRLITVGRLARFKGHEFGVECVRILKEKGYNIQYTIVGNGEQYDKLQELIRRSDLTNEVFLIGAQSQKEVKNYLQNHDIFLMTSITDLDYGVESQGLVTAEAQACGLPVVAFDSGGIKYTIEDGKTGFLCPEKDLNCYTSKIEKLISDEVLREEMSKNAVQFIHKDYSEDSVIKKWQNIYG